MTTILAAIKATAAAYGLAPAMLTGEARDAHAVQARHVAMTVAREATGASSTVIGRAFSGRDHTTVLNALSKIEAARGADTKLNALIESLKATLTYREQIAAFGGIDTLATARRIAAQPHREAIGATVYEIAALATVFLDLWEVATAAEELAGALRELARREALPEAERPADGLFDTANDCLAAIEKLMAAIRGDNEETTDERA